MELMEAIRKRRSVRSFKDEGVGEENIRKILEAACMAPTAGNTQPWQFVVVKNPQVKKVLALSALKQFWMTEAPLIIVVCANLKRSESIYGERGETLYALQDTAAATQNILLTATSLGLAGCWVGAFIEEGVVKVLNLSPWVRPVALVPLGYPAEHPEPPYRFSLEEVVTSIE